MEQALNEQEEVMLQETPKEESKITVFGHPFKGISGSTIKLIALFSMLVDHTAAVLLEGKMMELYNQPNLTWEMINQSTIYHVYTFMRGFGRLGFPIFVFLLIEGFSHTHSKAKYAISLALFALISEVPFDLAFNKHVIEFTYQNVFFTLLLGLLVILGLDALWYKTNLPKAAKLILCIPVVAAGMVAASFLRTDYGQWGVLTIVLMYLFRRHKEMRTWAGCMTLTIMSTSELYAFFIMPLSYLYNGKRGLKLKYVFYAFYPVHLLVLYFIARLIGIR